MYFGGELDGTGTSFAAQAARSDSAVNSARARNCTGTAGFGCTRTVAGPDSFCSPQLQQSLRHSFAIIPGAMGQLALASLMPIGHAAAAASARNGHVNTWAAGIPARIATTTTAANWTIRFIRLL